MAPFRLSIAAHAPATGELRSDITALAQAGFRIAEIDTAEARALLAMPVKEQLDLRHFAEDSGISLTDGHLLNQVDLGISDEAKRRGFIDEEKRCIDLFVRLGITVGAIHPGCWENLFGGVAKEQTRAQLARSLQELADHSKGMPFTVCLENCPDSAPDPETLVEMVDSAERENLGFCYDTGHMNLTAPDPAAMVKLCGKRLKALHLHDNAGMHDRTPSEQGYWYADDLHILPGFFRRSVNWRAFRLAMEEIGYDGVWNMELSFGAWPREFRPMMLRHARELGEMLFGSDWYKTQE